VIGPNANEVRHMLGDYAYPCHIETLIEMKEKGTAFHMPFPENIDMVGNFVPIRPILDGIADKVGPQTRLLYAKGCDVLGDSRDGFAAAVEAAQNADVAIVVVGGKSGLVDSCTTGEARDCVDLGLTGMQLELVKAVYATGTPVVVVLVNGRPLAIPWIAEHIAAVVEAWLPGEEGAEAVADVLFGDYNPGGKLPITLPVHVGQVPIYYGVKPSGGRSHWKETYVDCSNKPLFPFGHGLSYTTFALRDLRVARQRVPIGESIALSVEIANTGDCAGDEVVQLYVRDEVASVTRPLLELKGFKRMHLAPGEVQTLQFELHTTQLAFYDRDMRLVVEPGDLTIWAGFSSADLPLSCRVELTGDMLHVTERVYFSASS